MNAHPPIISCETAPKTQALPKPPATVDSALLDTGKPLFDRVSKECSALTTKAYSTSFSLGIRMLSAELRAPIQAVYGFVRFADEIVDTFHDFDKEELFKRFKHKHTLTFTHLQTHSLTYPLTHPLIIPDLSELTYSRAL